MGHSAKLAGNIEQLWDNDWSTTDPTTNKLREIKNTTKKFENLDLLRRRETMIITRLRIGHSLATHGYLMDRGAPPTCICGLILSIKHIFNDCRMLANAKRKFNIHSLAYICNNEIEKLRNVLEFLKYINLYSKI